ncbi:hypothetical protein CA264_02780 [Pontibacter actiniarum]|uniref:STAS/SEC14 domain-containing protein n=2 Tax=Pontibacter actiniarum TaxID=323450 RepID=A0A1X9YNL2_9BACT|nr:hypothetical protein CA264_02780 [Pontibacter actiniarum]
MEGPRLKAGSWLPLCFCTLNFVLYIQLKNLDMNAIEQTQQAIYRAPKLNVYVTPALRVLTIQPKGNVPSAIYRAGMTAAAETAINSKLLHWLVNAKAGGIVTPADQIWTSDVIAPRLAAASCVRKMAFVEPDDLHTKLILEDMMNKASDLFSFEMQFFAHAQDALVWFTDTETDTCF